MRVGLIDLDRSFDTCGATNLTFGSRPPLGPDIKIVIQEA